MKFKVGDKVMARWPGSSLYYPATITKIDEDEADVLYEDGTEMDVPIQHLANETVFKRKKSKSPARRRSRSPARTSRRSKSPARQSIQSRVTPEKISSRGEKSLSTTNSSSSEDTKPEPPPSPTRVTLQQRGSYISTENDKGVEKITTRSYQAELVLEKFGSNDMSRKNADDTLEAARKTIANAKKITSKPQRHEYEFGGPIGAVFQYIFTPIAIIALISCCSTSKCELQKFRLDKIPRVLSAYYDPDATLIILGYLLFQAVIYALPLGNIVEGPRTYSGQKTQYRISAFYTLIFTTIAYAVLVYYQYPVTIIINKMLPMATVSIVLCYVFNILLHIKSYFTDDCELNPMANTGWTIYDMFMGRELHPRFGSWYQFKLLMYRPSTTGWIFVNLIYLQKELMDTGTIRPALAIVAGCQIFYCVFVFFWDETQTIYSFDIKNEALSFQGLIGNLAIVPFIYTMHLRYLLEHPKAELVPMPILVTAVAVLALGLALVLLSGYQKMYFRLNPYDPSLSGCESIPPSKKGGKRILVSGYWGFVRHPNYLGEILLGLGYGLMCGFSDFFPWVYFIFVSGLMAHRAIRNEARCQEAHGYAWTEYCKRVRYRIVPYVF